IDAFEHRRLQHRAVATAAAQQRRTRRHGLPYPAVETLRFPDVDHGADEGILVAGVAALEGLYPRDELFPQRVVERLVRQDALHTDAALSRLIESTEGQPFDHEVEPVALVRIDDTGGITAEFQHDFLLAGARLQVPAHAG